MLFGLLYVMFVGIICKAGTNIGTIQILVELSWHVEYLIAKNIREICVKIRKRFCYFRKGFRGS